MSELRETTASSLSPRFAVILPAAGRSLRFGSSKLAERLAGQSVLSHSVAAFIDRPDVCQLIIAAHDPGAALALLPTAWQTRVTFSTGGDTRAESVRAAFSLVTSEATFVAIHDAARPLVTQDLIARTFAAAFQHGAAAPAIAVTQTIKQAAGPLPAFVERTLPRHTLWALQTPQVIRQDLLATAWAHAAATRAHLAHITDDLQLLELAGLPATLIPGEESNLKITFPQDLHLADLHLASLHLARTRLETEAVRQNAPQSGHAAQAGDNPPPAKHS